MQPPFPPSLTERARRVFTLARVLADRRGDAVLTSAHIALGLLQAGESIPVFILHTRGVPLDALARELEAELPAPGVPRSPPSLRQWTPEDDAFVEHAIREARALDIVYTGCEHLLLALLRDRESAPARALARYGVRYEDARAAVQWIHDAQPGASPPWNTAG